MLSCISLLYVMMGIALPEECLLRTIVVAKRWLHFFVENPSCYQEVVACWQLCFVMGMAWHRWPRCVNWPWVVWFQL